MTSCTGFDAPVYLISHGAADGSYAVWRCDPSRPDLLAPVPTAPEARVPAGAKLCAVGAYLLQYDLSPLAEGYAAVPYRLFAFDPESPDPLGAPSVQAGAWPQHKFWQFYARYTWDPTVTDIVDLVPVTGYVLAFMPTEARGTFMLWNFDPNPDAPGSSDPLPEPLGPQDAFSLIGKGSTLLPMGNTVLEWVAASSTWRVWSFDPQQKHPLALPTLGAGTKPEIGPGHRLLALGGHLLDIDPASGAFRLWGYEPGAADPFTGPWMTGTLPEGFDAGARLTPVEMPVPVDPARAATPGTVDFMRERIDHVVVYMLESRTADSVLGWLYETGAPARLIGSDAPYDGNSLSNANPGPDGTPCPVYVYADGKVSEDILLAAPWIDPFHSTSDSIRQQYSKGYAAYLAGEPGDQRGYVTSSDSPEPMVSFSNEQLPVLTGLARAYGVSDAWFSPMPGGTTANRAFALTGSNDNVIVNLEGEPEYTQFASVPRRQSIWKVLQNNGSTDWKIYYQVLWGGAVFTEHLYLRGQLPSVDAKPGAHVQPQDAFWADAAAGTLPRFSFLEPAWIAPSGATSYHPGKSGDMVPGEVMLNRVYEALRDGPGWERTALVVTFSKGGGLYDHVVPGPATPAWPQDAIDGFRYDVFGPRVPAIVVSPLVAEGTVFRSGGDVPFSATSILSTLLEWSGVPRTRWGLGDRVPQSPVFANVFTRTTPRGDRPAFTPPFDSLYTSEGTPRRTPGA